MELEKSEDASAAVWQLYPYKKGYSFSSNPVVMLSFSGIQCGDTHVTVPQNHRWTLCQSPLLVEIKFFRHMQCTAQKKSRFCFDLGCPLSCKLVLLTIHNVEANMRTFSFLVLSFIK